MLTKRTPVTRPTPGSRVYDREMIIANDLLILSSFWISRESIRMENDGRLRRLDQYSWSHRFLHRAGHHGWPNGTQGQAAIKFFRLFERSYNDDNRRGHLVGYVQFYQCHLMTSRILGLHQSASFSWWRPRCWKWTAGKWCLNSWACTSWQWWSVSSSTVLSFSNSFTFSWRENCPFATSETFPKPLQQLSQHPLGPSSI